MLKEITFNFYSNTLPSEFLNTLYYESLFVGKLFVMKLKKYHASSCHKLIIAGTDNTEEIGKTEDYSTIEGINLIKYFSIFDFKGYASSDRNNKKYILLDFLYKSFYHLADMKNWELTQLEQAYNECIKEKIVCQWFHKDGMPIKIKDQNSSYKIIVRWELNDYDILLVKYNLNGREEIERNLFFSLRINEIEPLDGAGYDQKEKAIYVKLKITKLKKLFYI